MHKAVTLFLTKVKHLYPQFFSHVRVLECGSLNINGSPRDFFHHSVYTGIDIAQGRGVDEVSLVHAFRPNRLYDVVVSTEMLEHDQYYNLSMNRMFELLRPGGLLIITAAAYDRPIHGVTDHHPKDSPLTHDYYRAIGIQTFESSLPMHGFSEWTLSSNPLDIQFYGIKKAAK